MNINEERGVDESPSQNKDVIIKTKPLNMSCATYNTKQKEKEKEVVEK